MGGACLSTWWAEGSRLVVVGVWGVRGVIVLRPVKSVVDIADLLPQPLKHLLNDREDDAVDLHYFLGGEAVRLNDGKIGRQFEVELLDAAERALAEHTELGTRHVWLEGYQRPRRRLDFFSQLADEQRREGIDLLSGVRVIHGRIPFERRLMARARAAARARLVDDIVAARAAKRGRA